MPAAFSITVDITEAVFTIQALGLSSDQFVEDMKGEFSNVLVAEETKLTPIATKDWDPSGKHRKGELMRSISEQRVKDDRIIGPTAVSDARGRSPGGYPYGLSVKRGVAWRGRPSMAGPRPFDEWTIDRVSPFANEIADRVTDDWLRRFA